MGMYSNSINLGRYKRRLGLSLMLVMITVLAIMTYLNIYAVEWLKNEFLNCSFFELKGISISGNNRISSRDIIKVSGLSVGNDRVFSFMSHIVEKRIKAQYNYLERVKIERDISNGWVRITVKERKPIAIIPASGTGFITVLDVNGFVLEKVSSTVDINSLWKEMPLIVGVDTKAFGKNERKIDRLSFSTVYPALNVLKNAKSLVPELFCDISDIDARDPDDIALHLQGGITIRLASDRIEEGLKDAGCLLLDTRFFKRKSSVKYIDVRFPGAIYCGGEMALEGGCESG